MPVDLTRSRGSGLVSIESAAAGAPEGRSAGEDAGRFARKAFSSVAILFLFFLMTPFTARAQQLLGSINGTVTDTSGGVVPGATVKVMNIATNLTLTETTGKKGSYNVLNLPIGTYTVTVTKTGFKAVVHSEVLVEANRASTVNTALEPGAITAEVTVTATPLLDQTDTTNGYVLSSKLIQETPLGTGSFTQLATMAPGVSADLLSGSGTNAGLGNQDIWANGQRDTSNSVSFNGISGNNVFNGMTSSSVGASRFVLNTNEQFLPGGQIQTNTSVYDAIGQGMPTPPPETIEEMHVMTSMYDASQGANSGAHVEVVTKSGTNNFHGQAYEYHQTTGWNANPFFMNAQGIPRQPLHRNTFGGTFGGPILHNKMFFFGSYQGQRVTDAFNGATTGVNVPIGLSSDRSASTLAALANADYGTSLTANNIDPVALKIMQAKTSSGQFVVPSQTISDPNQIAQLGYNAFVQGPPSTFNADQINANIDYNFSQKDRLAEKYYYQRDPSTSPFAVSQTLGFPQSLKAGSQVFSLDNITELTPTTSWEQRIGFVREVAYANTGQTLTPQDAGINLLGSSYFPGFDISNPTDTSQLPGGTGGSLRIGPSNNFANAGAFQNQLEASTNYSWIKGIHNLSFGASFDYGQLNIINKENQVATFNFHNFVNFLTGTMGGKSRSSGTILNGETNRYYRYKQAGLYAQDQIRVKSNLNVDVGLRWDWDGPLSEKNGLLTNFYPQDYQYNLATDTIQNIGLVVSGNNKQFCGSSQSYCVGNSTLTGRQWLIGPRIGIAWSPTFVKNLVVRAGFGLYADRGEFFTEFSPSAGLGISGPFGVTTEEPFTVPFKTTCSGAGCLGNNPFGTSAPPPPPNNFSGVQALVHNMSGLSGCAEPVTPTCTPTGYANFAFLFGGYDPKNTLPYSENWTLDLQWQPTNSFLFDLGYVGNRGLHQLLPVPFNQALIATPQHPVNGQIYSYGFQATDAAGNPLATEQVMTTIGDYSFNDGNTALRVPYIGYNPNSNYWEATGISDYNALQFSVKKRMSHGLAINASYTWSHTLDEGGGLAEGLFYNGNDPLNPRSAYGNASYDRTHVLTVGYIYQIPGIAGANGFLKQAVNGWGIGGMTVAESGQPYSVYDFSGDVASQYWGAGDDFITNPLLAIPGGNAQSVQLQGTTGVNPANPVLNAAAFGITVFAPGTNGVPPCGPTTAGNTTACDYSETGYAAIGRNSFRGPFQTRFDFDVFKNFKLTERFSLRYDAQFFNLFNHPSFDTPNNDFQLDPCYGANIQTAPGGYSCQWYGTIPAVGSSGPIGNGQALSGTGYIQNPLGSPRFIQMALHLIF
ncbi:MAG: TonB-dependent receptor [Acidobacteriota bacterium]|nr:TonB-dependent receptor [Acidobacteriota bacterium]